MQDIRGLLVYVIAIYFCIFSKLFVKFLVLQVFVSGATTDIFFLSLAIMRHALNYTIFKWNRKYE